MDVATSLTVPLLVDVKSIDSCDGVTKYARAGLLSRCTFSWMNSLLDCGSRKTIEIHDVPSLAPQHRASILHSRFTHNWRSRGEELDDDLSNAVLRTLWRTFWRPFATCGALALTRLSVVFVGPLLIRRFVSHSWENSNPSSLVAILVAAKLVEVVASHQYNFACQKLGMQIRSALITSIFRKGLLLSSASRQRHGVGQIVNYMSVDVQQMSDVMLQVHYLWVVPVQIAIAVSILVYVMGVAGLAGLLVMAMAAGTTVFIACRLNGHQGNIMQGRDRRMKVFNESLQNMKVHDMNHI